MPTLLTFAIINLITFLAFGYDKSRARRQASRISEQNLLLLVMVGGGVGAVAGMIYFRHKTAKKTFNRRLWSIIIAQIILTSLLFYVSAY